MICLAIADDHAILRSGLRQILATTADIEVVAEATNAAQTLALLTDTRHDIDCLLLDLMMPGSQGTELISALLRLRPNLPILVLSMHNERPVVQRALKAGAQGYANKDIHPEVLLAAIRKVASGGRFIDPALAEALMFTDLAAGERPPLHDQLSEREFQILQRLVSGQRLSDIAADLYLSPKTVSTYKTRLMEKLNVTSNAELIRYAMQAGISPPPPPKM